ncbi:MAG: YeeE/YedE family protein [Bdellovibrionales bacterium]|nr:YeeE/YedE family protein [Bdellovibrionales bacterium]
MSNKDKGNSQMNTAVAALAVGFIFAVGLGISGMTKPSKVVGFLDLFGNWDPSLMFVMAGAIGVHFVTYKIIRKRATPLLVPNWQVPTKTELTPALVIGAVLFGVGWGLGGFCPGPAMTSLASLQAKPVIFVISMLVGMYLFKLVDRKLKLKK